MKDSKHHIRYLGFEAAVSGGRRLEYAITSPEHPSRRAVVEIPVEAFTGPHRVTYQDGAAIGYERLRVELEAEGIPLLSLTLSLDEVDRFRPRRRAASKRV